MAVQPDAPRLLANSRFRRLMEARAVAQTGQNAMLYALLILVVNQTASSIHSTLLVTAWMLPCILIGVPARSVADALSKPGALVTGYAHRGALAAAMILYVDDVWTLYLLVLAFSSVGQVSGRAEAAALPLLVRRDQLAGANPWMVLSLMVGQGAGGGALGAVVLTVIRARAWRCPPVSQRRLWVWRGRPCSKRRRRRESRGASPPPRANYRTRCRWWC